MPSKGYKKTTPRITSDDVYSYIANHSSLTREQVKECFCSYQEMMQTIIQSDNRSDDLTIAVPKLGVFYFHKKKGKKGSTYVVPVNFTTEYERVTGDTPNYVQLKFTVARYLKNQMRKKTENYSFDE